LDCEAIITSMVGETHEPICHMLKDELNEVKCMKFQVFQAIVYEENHIGRNWSPWAFMHVAKKGDAFFIYALLAIDVKPQQHKLLSQYKGYKDVFKKIIVNTL